MNLPSSGGTRCCCGTCTQDASRLEHFCSLSGERCFAMCFLKGAPEVFGSRWPCIRCVELWPNVGPVLTLTAGICQQENCSYPRTLAVTSPPLAIVASCIEALAFTFNFEELDRIVQISPIGSDQLYLARLMKSLVIKSDFCYSPLP